MARGQSEMVNAASRQFRKRRAFCYAARNPESKVPRPNLSLISLAIIGAFALALAGCGRKGALDPPPGGYALERSTTTTPVTGQGTQLPPRSGPAYDEEGKPIAPEGPRRRSPADWLID
jgi:predicted small lipoprotein YifL